MLSLRLLQLLAVGLLLISVGQTAVMIIMSILQTWHGCFDHLLVKPRSWLGLQEGRCAGRVLACASLSLLLIFLL
jgi:hypothetical protein